ncbi:extracellular solute-binding protein [Paenibacillus sp. GCM10027626]|uniref:extracellular solute-binding protein n=1 Tax=Paenibacillus sp. GCM10027626 TaxID=3273411 RepID=UPI00362AFD8D
MVRYAKLVAVALSVVLLSFAFLNAAAEHSSGSEIPADSYEGPVVRDREPVGDQASGLRYEQYIARYSEAPRPAGKRIIEAESFAGTDEMDAVIWDDYENAGSSVVRTEDSGSIHWEVNVEEDGLYQIGIRYFPVEGHTSPIERELQIDGAAPFEEAKRLVFSRVWGNLLSHVERDSRGNDLRPRQIEQPEWQETLFRDAEGYYSEGFSFYFSRGKHRITLVSLREPMVIDRLQLMQAEKPVAYAELLQMYAAHDYPKTSGRFVKVQGEDAIRKSSPSLFPLNDRSSPETEPYHVSKIRMNTIGGDNWKLPGQWIMWEVDIPENGLYELGLRYKQNKAAGINVVRKLYIDDKVPFLEADTLPFSYNGAWQTELLGNAEQPYLFYLTKGRHELKLEVSMGELADIIQMVRSGIRQLNALYLKVIMLTGAVPDEFRDYRLGKQIPEIGDVFREESKRLSEAADRMDRMVGKRSGSSTLLRTTAYQLADLSKDPETLPRRMKAFKDNVSSLGTWLLTVNEQPLLIDYLFLKSPNVEMPKADKGFFGRLKHELLSFSYSFTEDYNGIGSNGGSDPLTVWIAAGRDQAQLLRTMIDSMFTPKTGIEVDLQLINPAVLLPATLAGKNPDVAISAVDVINFAMRNALQDLTQFPDFPEVKKRFMNSAFPGFTFKDGIYALPETQTFPMLFFRKDIFGQIGLDIPDTWEQFYRIIPELQKRNMEIGLAPTPVLEMMLYQNGGRYYQGDGVATDLDSAAGVESFRKWTELYTNYKLPVQFDFINRFRTGEMPIGIADYTTFNFLTIFAPEIRGQWDFAPVPGTVSPDGTIHREVLSTASGTVMFKSAKNKQAAWDFMKWWTDTEAQVMFGREMEAILGESARYAAANTEALKQLPWSAKDYKRLVEQLEWVVGTPEVPGSYSLQRHLTNAFFEVVEGGSEPRETLENFVRIINEELTIKRQEFHLPTK